MPAADAGGIPLDVAQQRLLRVGQLAVCRQHRAPLREVAAGVDEHTLGLEPVAAGAASLLLIVLERLRRARVNDEPDVGSIDAHAEGDRCDDDVGIFVEERVLMPMPRLVVEAGVIGHGAHADFDEARRRARRPRGATGSRRCPLRRGGGRARPEAAASSSIERARDRRGSDGRTIRRARPGSAAPSCVDDVAAAHASVAVAVNACRLTRGPSLAQPAELAVLRPEVVAPLADAVRLVDGDEARRADRRDATETRRCPRPRAAPARRTAAGRLPLRCRAITSRLAAGVIPL